MQGIEAGLHVDKVLQKCTRGIIVRRRVDRVYSALNLALTIARDSMPDAAGDTNYDAIYISSFKPTACKVKFTGLTQTLGQL